ncbi:MAG TPA: site-2 protease family protein [Pyrinomonadaceae bacterium]
MPLKVSEFFHRQILVARVYGIPVRIDYRWFFVFGLSVWLIAQNLQRGTMRLPPVSLTTALVLSVITTLALFLSVFGHELSHALAARGVGIETEEIVLHPFGGLARLRSEPDSPRAEFRIAVAGPLASLLFSLFSFGAMAVARMGGYRTTAAIFMFVGFSNLLLAVFNLFPGYPLDGGRVLRAALWRRGGDIAEATRIAGICGQVIAWTLVVFGVFGVFGLFVPRDPFMGLWSVLVGMFLLDAAVGVVRESRGLKTATVGEAMSAPISIEPDVLVSHFVDEIFPRYQQTSFPVAHARRLHGILSLEDLRQLPRERWRQARARDVMRPVAPQLFVDPATTVARANEIMRRNGVGALAVINQTGELVGFLQRGQVKRRK